MAGNTAISQSRQLYDELAREQEAAAEREKADWAQVAGAFVGASKGNRIQAQRLFEIALDRLLDGGALSMPAYRGIVNAIREGG